MGDGVNLYIPDYTYLTGATWAEKYDGINARWDGARLLSSEGNDLFAPEWFTAGLPDTPFEAEIWAGRGRFEVALSGIKGGEWSGLILMVFDLPDLPATEYHAPVIWRPVDEDTDGEYARIVAEGGEGIVYRLRDGEYAKRKPVTDADARVVGYAPGRGACCGLVGALIVEAEGVSFRIGSGLSMLDRNMPPVIGEVIRYYYQGKTARGIPRFPVFISRRLERIA